MNLGLVGALGRVVRHHWEWLVAGALVPVAWLLHTSYGMAWDDAQHAAYGGLVLDYFLSGFSDMRWRDEMGLLKLYGTAFDLPSAAIHRALGVDLLRHRPFLMAVWGILSVPAVAGIGRIVGGERCAGLSIAALLMMPQFIGQSFINCKDIPLATAFAWACLIGMRSYQAITWRRILAAGLWLGVAAAVRLNGGMLAAMDIVALLGFGVLQQWQGTASNATVGKMRQAFFAIGCMVGIGGVVLVAAWPYAHGGLLSGPMEAFRTAEAFPDTVVVRFAGHELKSNCLPWHYLPTMLLLTTPLTIAVPALLGAVLAGRALAGRWRQPAAGPLFLLLLWIVFPVIYVVIRRPNIYDGVRHFLFVLPAAAVLAAIGLGWIVGAVLRHKRRVEGMAIAAWIFVTAPLLVTWHPYQYVFHNVVAGDRTTLHERFETDYWMTSYREAAAAMNDLQARATRSLELFVGANHYSAVCFTYYASAPMHVTYGLVIFDEPSLPEGIDYFVTIPRYGMWRNFPDAPIAHEIRRCGVLMCTIKERSVASGQEPEPERSRSR